MSNATAHIGLVDPDPNSLMAISKIFTVPGYRTVPVTNPTDLIAKLNEHHFDLILSEWELPGFSGEEFCKTLLAKVPAIPVIFLSSIREPEVRLCALHSGAVDFLTKPFDRDYLRAKIEAVLAFRRRLKPVCPSTDLRMEKLLSAMKRQNIHALLPKPDLQSEIGFSYDLSFAFDRETILPEDQLELLSRAHQKGVLERELSEVIKICPDCSSFHIILRQGCPFCHKPVVTTENSTALCSFCSREVKDPVVSYHCASCGKVFDDRESQTQSVYTYFLPEKTIDSFPKRAPESFLSRLAEKYGLQLLPHDLFDPFVRIEKKQHEAIQKPYALLQFRILQSVSNEHSERSEKKLGHFFLLLRKVLDNNEILFLHPPHLISVFLPYTPPKVAEEKHRRLNYYLRQFELLDLVKSNLSTQDLEMVLGFLEHEGQTEESLP